MSIQNIRYQAKRIIFAQVAANHFVFSFSIGI